MTTTLTMTAEQVICPDWCTVPVAEHLADLHQWEGAVIHRGDFRRVSISTCTDPAGNDLEPPQLTVVSDPGT